MGVISHGSSVQQSHVGTLIFLAQRENPAISTFFPPHLLGPAVVRGRFGASLPRAPLVVT